MKQLQFLIRIEHKTGALAGVSELVWSDSADGHEASAFMKASRANPDAACSIPMDNQGQLITRVV